MNAGGMEDPGNALHGPAIPQVHRPGPFDAEARTMGAAMGEIARLSLERDREEEEEVSVEEDVVVEGPEGKKGRQEERGF